MKKIFIKISEKIYPEGIDLARGYDPSNYKPIMHGMIEVLLEPSSIDERTHLMAISCIGVIPGARKFGFSGICEQSQIGDIFIPSASLAISIANMLKQYFEHFKKPYNATHIDNLVKKILDDITNNIPVKKIFQSVKVVSPGVYRQMSTEYRSRYGHSIENSIEQIVKDQETYTFSSFLGIIRHADLTSAGGINYKNLISNLAGMRRVAIGPAPVSSIPQPAKGAPATKGPDKRESIHDEFPVFKPGQYVRMNFSRQDLLAKGFKSEDLEKNQNYTTKQLNDKKMTFRDKIFYVVKKVSGSAVGFYTVAGLDNSRKVVYINVWGAFLKPAPEAEKRKGISSLSPNQTKRFMGGLGLDDKGDDAEKETKVLDVASQKLGYDFFTFIAYYKDALKKKAMKSFKTYKAEARKEAKNPGLLKDLKKRFPSMNPFDWNPSSQGGYEGMRNKQLGKDEPKGMAALRAEGQITQEASRLLMDGFKQYAEKYPTNSELRAKQLKMKVADYDKKIEEAGKNGMSLPEYLKNQGAIEQEDADEEASGATIANYMENPYNIMVNLDKIKAELAMDNSPMSKNKDFVEFYKKILEDENARTEAFMKHVGATGENPEDDYLKVQKGFISLDKESGKEGLSEKLMPKLYAKNESGFVGNTNLKKNADSYIKDPYKFLLDFRKINEMIKDPAVANNEDFINMANSISKNEKFRIKTFLKHNGLPLDFVENRELAIENFQKIQAAMEKFDQELESSANIASASTDLLPKLSEFIQEIHADAAAYDIMKGLGVPLEIFKDDKVAQTNKGKLDGLLAEFKKEQLTDQATKLQEIIERISKTAPAGKSTTPSTPGAGVPPVPAAPAGPQA